MVDLDSDPTKLIEVVEIRKELLMTRGAALFAGTLPWL
jgi:high-affinity K+ transport system ATPase subunit B